MYDLVPYGGIELPEDLDALGGDELKYILADMMGGDDMDLIEDFGGDDDDYDFGGIEDDWYDLGGDEIGGRRRRRRRGFGRLFSRGARALLTGGISEIVRAKKEKRKAKKRRRARRAQAEALKFHSPKQAKSLAQPEAMATVAKTGGRKFLTPAGCTLTISPIPVESRVPNGVGRQALRQSALILPNAPLVTAVTGIGTGTIDAPLPNPTQEGEVEMLPFFVIRVDIGLPGLTVAAGTQITFRVYTQQTLPLIAGPEIVDTVEGAFDSGLITITPFRSMEISSLVIVPYRIVQAQPLPRLGRVDYKAISGGAFVSHGLTLEVVSAPAATNSVLTIVNPQHPTWQAVARDIGWTGL